MRTYGQWSPCPDVTEIFSYVLEPLSRPQESSSQARNALETIVFNYETIFEIEKASYILPSKAPLREEDTFATLDDSKGPRPPLMLDMKIVEALSLKPITAVVPDIKLAQSDTKTTFGTLGDEEDLQKHVDDKIDTVAGTRKASAPPFIDLKFEETVSFEMRETEMLILELLDIAMNEVLTIDEPSLSETTIRDVLVISHDIDEITLDSAVLLQL